MVFLNRIFAKPEFFSSLLAEVSAGLSEGRGKHLKDRDPYAIKFHREWEMTFKRMRECLHRESGNT